MKAKKLNKVLALIMALVMIFGVLPMSVFAGDEQLDDLGEGEEVIPVEDELCLLSLKAASSKSGDANVFEMTPEFDPAVKDYTVTVPDKTGNFYVWTTLPAAYSSATVKAEYHKHNDNTLRTVTLTGSTSTGLFIGSNKLTGNTMTITVDAGDGSGKTAVYTITAKRSATLKTLSLSDSSESEQLYALNETFNALTYSYSVNIPHDASIKINALPTCADSKVEIVGAVDGVFTPVWDSNRTASVTLTVSAEGVKSSTYTLTLFEKPVEITITSAPNKTVYSLGENFDLSGLAFKIKYADGYEENISAENMKMTPSGALTLEDDKVVFKYNGITVEQPVTVVKHTFKGSGTQEDPYLIENADDMTALSNEVNIGNSFEGIYFKMTDNIELPASWKPIGCTKDGSNNIMNGKNLYAFSGSIDGNNHLLTVPKGGLPLLGYINGAEVKNLRIFGEQIDGYGLVNNFSGVGLSGNAVVIENVTIESGSKILKSGLLGGDLSTNIFAGNSAKFVATVRNCTIEENVLVGYDGSQEMIGSFAGRMQGTVENCVSYATVKGKNYVGGIIGTRDNALGTCTVVGCKFYGIVEASGDNVGGIVGGGYSNSSAPNGIKVTVKDCEVKGTITGQNNVGGILGGDVYVAQAWDEYEFTGNSFEGTVSGESNVGGVIGFYDSLNKFDNISDNSYTLDCGAKGAFGNVKYVDTNFVDPTEVENTLYFNTENDVTNCPSVKGCSWKTAYNRTDDPLGSDAEKLAKGVYSEKQLEDIAKAEEVEKLIDEIGEVDLNSKNAIATAENAYNALTDDQKALVENYDALVEARNVYDALKTEELIKALPEADKVTLKDGNAIKEARKAYDALTKEGKSLVSEESVKKLEEAEAAYNKLVPKTGDSMDVIVYTAALVIAAMVLVVVVYKKRSYSK